MRNKLRIPITCNYFNNVLILQNFLKTDDRQDVLKILDVFTSVMLEWNNNPDYRFGQLLSNMNLVSKEVEDHIWNIEESDWLVNNNYLKFEEINFWGNLYFKNGAKRKKVKYIRLKDLENDHIENILKYFNRYHALTQLNTSYLEYFISRVYE